MKLLSEDVASFSDIHGILRVTVAGAKDLLCLCKRSASTMYLLNPGMDRLQRFTRPNARSASLDWSKYVYYCREHQQNPT